RIHRHRLRSWSGMGDTYAARSGPASGLVANRHDISCLSATELQLQPFEAPNEQTRVVPRLFVRRKLHARRARKQLFDRDLRFQAREGRAQAEVDPAPEREVLLGLLAP